MALDCARDRECAAVTDRGVHKYAAEEELLEHSPAAHVRRPRLDYESHGTAMDRNELADRLGGPAEQLPIALAVDKREPPFGSAAHF
jgi:hypothetical protein